MEDITNEQLRALDLLKKKERLYNAFYLNNGLAGIYNEAYQILGNNTLAVCDPSLAIIEARWKDTYDKVLERKDDKIIVRSSALEGMRNDRFLDLIYSSNRPFYFSSPYIDNRLIAAPVKIKRSVVGYIVLVENVHSFSDTDLELIDELSHITSAEFQKSDFFGVPRKLRYDYLVAELLEGHINDIEYFKIRLQQLGRTLKKNIWVMVIGESQKILSREVKDFIFQNLLSMFPLDVVSVHKNQFVILISRSERFPLSADTTYRLNNFLKYHHLIAGVSFQCDDLLSMPEYYEQAKNILHACHKSTDSNIIFCNDCIIESIFMQCENVRFLRSIIHPDILLLEKYDAETNSQLLLTLQTYLLQNRNAVNTAKALNIHKSTFFYRMERIKDLTGFQMFDCHQLFNYEISFHVLDYLNDIASD